VESAQVARSPCAQTHGRFGHADDIGRVANQVDLFG